MFITSYLAVNLIMCMDPTYPPHNIDIVVSQRFIARTNFPWRTGPWGGPKFLVQNQFSTKNWSPGPIFEGTDFSVTESPHGTQFIVLPVMGY